MNILIKKWYRFLYSKEDFFKAVKGGYVKHTTVPVVGVIIPDYSLRVKVVDKCLKAYDYSQENLYKMRDYLIEENGLLNHRIKYARTQTQHGNIAMGLNSNRILIDLIESKLT